MRIIIIIIMLIISGIIKHYLDTMLFVCSVSTEKFLSITKSNSLGLIPKIFINIITIILYTFILFFNNFIFLFILSLYYNVKNDKIIMDLLKFVVWYSFILFLMSQCIIVAFFFQLLVLNIFNLIKHKSIKEWFTDTDAVSELNMIDFFLYKLYKIQELTYICSIILIDDFTKKLLISLKEVDDYIKGHS